MNQQSLRIFSCLSSEVKSAPVGKTPKTNMGWSIQRRLNASCQALRDNNAVFWGLDVNLGHSILSSLLSPSMDFFLFCSPLKTGSSWHACWSEPRLRCLSWEKGEEDGARTAVRPPKESDYTFSTYFLLSWVLTLWILIYSSSLKMYFDKEDFLPNTAYTKHTSLRSCRRSTSPASTWMMSWILGAKL